MTEKSCINLINYTHKNVLSNLLKSIFPLLKLSLNVHIKLTSSRNNKTNFSKRSSLKDEARKNLEEKKRKKEHSIEELCISFVTILALFVYNLSFNKIASEVIISYCLFFNSFIF